MAGQRYKGALQRAGVCHSGRAAACRGKREDPLWHDGLSGSAQRQRLTHIIVENKDGRFAIPVRSAVDATGDADLFHQAAAPVRLHEAGNMPAAWFYETGAEGNVLHMVGTADVPTDEENPAVPDPVVGGRISGVDADEISRRQISCHGRALPRF